MAGADAAAIAFIGEGNGVFRISVYQPLNPYLCKCRVEGFFKTERTP
jgi:hypothetical protein